MKKFLLLLLWITLYHLAPAQVPSLFLDGVVSTNLSERDMAISPDGNEMYYTIQSNQHVFSTIVHRRKISEDKWSAADVATFSGMSSDLEPSFSPDGKKLYFSSDRASAEKSSKDYDIWVVEKTSNGWSSPKNIGWPVNTTANEFYPSITNDGSIYFTAEYDKGVGKEDIYVSKLTDGIFSNPVPLDTAINSKLWEFNAFVAPDESFIAFTSYGRKDDHGGGDLYISVKSNGAWKPAVNASALNSPQLDYCPFSFQDEFYFTSGRHSIKATRESPITYKELTKLYNGTLNGSENIYKVSLKEVLKSVMSPDQNKD
ncbi:MAG: hypothetical protein ABIS36_01785 [Chryseolinea sp.]